ncbi:hypothetical protein ABR738_35885 [Streptomyces sp. Edi4]|uniref:hypothetical protein n=1 Tax=Streptomyces sp. Edi4 TaxID=3162527 RepID=UPI0033060533
MSGPLLPQVRQEHGRHPVSPQTHVRCLVVGRDRPAERDVRQSAPAQLRDGRVVDVGLDHHGPVDVQGVERGPGPHRRHEHQRVVVDERSLGGDRHLHVEAEPGGPPATANGMDDTSAMAFAWPVRSRCARKLGR